MAVTKAADLVPAIRAKLEPKLLKHAQNTLVLDQFAQKGTIGKGENALTVTWQRQAVADSSRVSTIGTEGTNPTAIAVPQLEQVTVTMAQYGAVMQVTKVASYVAMFNQQDLATRILGEDAGLNLDTIIRNAIITGATNKRYAGGAADFSALSALSVDAGRFTRGDGLGAYTALRVAKTPKKNGGYYVIGAPEVFHDLKQDPDWLWASAYAKPDQLLKGEVGMLDGVRYVESDNCFRETSGGTEGTYSSSGGIYRSLAFGEEGYGYTALGDSKPTSPALIILDKADKSDPLNLNIMIGWQSYFGAKVLNAAFMRTISSKTTFA